MPVEKATIVAEPVGATTAQRPEPQGSKKKQWVIGLIAFFAVVGALAFGFLPRVKARATLRTETAEMAISTVAVVQPERAAPSEELVLPASVQAFISAPIFARTNGYLRAWYADIGAHVKKGQLLAEIETPEVDQQLRQSRADLATAEANLSLAEITARRFQDLLESNSVSQQDTDNAVGALAASRATVQSNQANVKRLEELQSFEKIFAPFDGIITARKTDIGALINAGAAGGQQTELFDIAQPDRLRVYVSVPEAYSQAAKPGLTAELSLAEFPGRRFQGKVVRTAEAIDPSTRTLLVQIEVQNPTGQLLTGSYAEVHMKLPSGAASYIVPVNTLLFRKEGLRLAIVRDGKVNLTPVSAGHDFGDRIQIVAGLNGGESVIVNPPDALTQGQSVRIAQPQNGSAQ